MIKYRDPHIGSLIKEKLEIRQISISDFAKAILSSRSNIYNILNSKSIDIDKLIVISEYLEYDFLSEYYKIDKKDKSLEVTLIFEYVNDNIKLIKTS
jgi:transcriptional regulator with XRE-family HTH domain